MLLLLASRPAPGQPNISYAWINLAGQPGGFGNVDGTGNAARFHYPSGVAADTNGNVYVADTTNNTIRKITAAGVVTTLAGCAGVSGSADGTNSTAAFSQPTGVAVDSAGNVFVADSGNNTIRKVTAAGIVTTLAGSAGVPGPNDGTGGAALFNYPTGVALDVNGNVFVADTYNHTIRKVTASGVVTTLAGNASITDEFGPVGGYADGTGTAARFNAPFGVAVDASGNVFVADCNNQAIRKVSATKVVTTFAGSAGNFGTNDGTGSAAQFYLPSGVTLDRSGNVFVADFGNQTIRKVTAGGVVTTLAGNASITNGDGQSLGGYADGTNKTARFNSPSGVAVDTNGNVFVADSLNHAIRKVTAAGVVTTLAGSAQASGSADGMGKVARFYRPDGLAVDAAGNVFVADTYNHTMRKVTASGVVTTLAGNAAITNVDGTPAGGYAEGTNKTAQFYYPSGVAVDANGNVFVADYGNHLIRKLTAVGTNWAVTTLAGSVGNPGSADGTGGAAFFYYPTGVAVDRAGNLFVADSANHTIRMVTGAGVVTTLAGSAGYPGSGDGTGSGALFNNPIGVAVDTKGNVFVADSGNHAIRQVTAAGVVTTLAGNPLIIDENGPLGGYADGTNSAARFSGPQGVAVDSAGNVFVADTGNQVIRKVTAAGVVTTIGGMAGAMGGADGLASGAQFLGPAGVATDSVSNLYVADSMNNRIARGTALPLPKLTYVLDGKRLFLSWRLSYLGWELQVCTNLLDVGPGANWLPVPGSTTNIQMSAPVGPATPRQFYRLRLP